MELDELWNFQKFLPWNKCFFRIDHGLAMIRHNLCMAKIEWPCMTPRTMISSSLCSLFQVSPVGWLPNVPKLLGLAPGRAAMGLGSMAHFRCELRLVSVSWRMEGLHGPHHKLCQVQGLTLYGDGEGKSSNYLWIFVSIKRLARLVQSFGKWRHVDKFWKTESSNLIVHFVSCSSWTSFWRSLSMSFDDSESRGVNLIVLIDSNW